ncbi:hypothetical protein Q1695_013938 [Nippostrongylus brasiliensis]|nr:hypothetical protein Q1695_013938 [Nippostrongylus brasiliensis]
MVNAQPPCRVHCPTPVRGSFSCEEQSSFRSSRHTETAVGMIPCQHWPEYWEFGEKVFRGNGAEGSPEPPKKLLIDNLSMEDVTLRERMTALESQNEQLLKELKKQREATQLLLKQFDDFAPRTCTTCGAESKAEVSESRSVTFDE